MRSYTRHWIPAITALGLLAGCGSEPEAPSEPETVEEPAPVEPTPVEPPAPPVVVAENVAEAPPVVEVSPDQQVLEDADATGMTARVDRSEPAADRSADKSAPAME